MTLLEEHIKNLKWPNPQDQLFNMADNTNWMNSYIDFYGKEDKFYIYALGYREAAEVIYNNLDSKTRHHDILVYPIIFLFRQSIELFLKDIIITSNKILSNDSEYPKHHSLSILWAETKKYIFQIIPEHNKKDESAMDQFITQFDKIDPVSFAFRYPEDKKGLESLYGIQSINLSNFFNVASGICNYLDSTDSVISEYWDNLKGTI